MIKIEKEQPKYKSFLNKRVRITSSNFANYEGTVCGFRDGKTCLSKVIILNKKGDYKAVSGGYDIVRWFNNSSITSIEVCNYE